VRPKTFVGWHRKGFRLWWRWKSRAGRRPIAAELQQLIRKLARENVTWGEERIANELLLSSDCTCPGPFANICHGYRSRKTEDHVAINAGRRFCAIMRGVSSPVTSASRSRRCQRRKENPSLKRPGKSGRFSEGFSLRRLQSQRA
jgi:hypothetical protein